MTLAMRKLIGSGMGGRMSKKPKPRMSLSPLCQPACQLFSDIPQEGEATAAEVVDNSSAPKATRSIIENDSLRDLIVDNCRCAHCGGCLQLHFKSIGIATTPVLSCSGCKLVCHSSIERTTLPRGKHPRTSDFSVNCQYVAAVVASGDGGSEAGRILGLLDLPNYATMEKYTFPKVEFMMSGQIQEVTKAALEANLLEEVRLTMQDDDDSDYDAWLAAVNSNEGVDLDTAQHAKINGGTDMAWQKRASGRLYNSLSGHELIIGAKTRKPIIMCVKTKFCRVCCYAKAKGAIPRNHRCGINHTDSSGSMEADALVDMVHELDTKWKCHMVKICTDDDSTMRARLRWNNDDHKAFYGTFPMVEIMKGKDKGKMRLRKCTGQLKPNIQEPVFVADPAHRKKTLRNRLYSFNNLSVKKKYGFGPADITRIVKNFSYFINSLPSIDHGEWETRACCVLDHHFDCHTNCGDFCLRKKELLEKTPEENKKKFYRCKTKDCKLYEALHDIVSGFVTMKRLEEVGHGMDTQPNEALNNTIAWKAPKGKTYCGSSSLENRISMAVSTHLIGPEEYFKRLYGLMGMQVRPGTAHYLRLQAKKLETKRGKQKKVDVKRRRNEKNFEKLKEQLAKQIQDIKRGNEYRSGVAMEVTNNTGLCAPVTVKACRCTATDHLRTSSSKCPWNKKNIAETTEAEQQAILDTVEVLDDLNKEETDEILAAIDADDDLEVEDDDDDDDDDLID